MVEGEKNLVELLNAKNWNVDCLCLTESFLRKYGSIIQKSQKVYEVSPVWLQKFGTLQTNDSGLAIVKIPDILGKPVLKPKEWVLALDQISDPGNLGTIIRIADWYGFTQIICNNNTAEWYNPKVIAASMGSFTRVEPHYLDLSTFLGALPAFIVKIGASMDGQNLHQFQFPNEGGILVMGSESHGLSESVLVKLTHKVTIPKFGAAESLNVGVAAGILCDSLLRSKIA